MAISTTGRTSCRNLLGARRRRPTVTEAAWYPLLKFDESLRGLRRGLSGLRCELFYFAAKIADDTPDSGMPRFVNLNDDDYFYPEKCFKVEKRQGRQGDEADRAGLAAEGSAATPIQEPELPSGNWPNHDNVQIAFTSSAEEKRGTRIRRARCRATSPTWTPITSTLSIPWRRSTGGSRDLALLVPGCRASILPAPTEVPLRRSGEGRQARLPPRRQHADRRVASAVVRDPRVKETARRRPDLKFSFRVNDNAKRRVPWSWRAGAPSPRSTTPRSTSMGEHWGQRSGVAFER